MTVARRWTEALDAYEARLLAVRDAIAAGNPGAVPPFAPPVDLGPMPEAVVERATALLVASRDLERTIQQARAAVVGRLQARPTSTASSAPRRASRLDVSV